MISRQNHSPARQITASTGARTQGDSSAPPSSSVAAPSTPPTATPIKRETPCRKVCPKLLWVQTMQAIQAYRGPMCPSIPPNSSRYSSPNRANTP